MTRAEDYRLNPDAIPIVEDWLRNDDGTELGALKYQAWLLVQDLRRRLAEAEAILALTKKLLGAKEGLLVAYRIGDQRRGGSALDRIAKLTEQIQAAEAAAKESPCSGS